MSARTFKLDLEKFLQNTDEQIDALASQVCQEVAFQVVNDTPVDTGFLRGSWQPSIGGESQAVGQPDKEGGIAIAAVSLTAAQVTAGDTFYMTNNAAYGPHVENGTAFMFPRHFVRRAVMRWQSIVEHVAKDLGMGVK